MSTKAIVTIVIGDQYLSHWRKFCGPAWNEYATKYGFDLITIAEPLDNSPRAINRSISWQKLLILEQEWSTKYEQVVWVDSDIMFNPDAPCITDGVPVDKIGCVEDTSFQPAFTERLAKLWPNGESVINHTVNQYYSQYGLPSDCSQTFNAGVMVVSPRHHREFFRMIYDTYEEKEGGRKWHMEQRPLSYHAVQSRLTHWIDPRFNVLLFTALYWTYPQLMPDRYPESRLRKLARMVRSTLSFGPSLTEATNMIYKHSHFLHFAAMMGEMERIKSEVTK